MHLNYNLFSLILFTFFSFHFSHSQTWEWVTPAEGLKSDKGTTIVVDAQGNSYITGYYNEEAQFGPFVTGFSHPNSKEVYVAKIDPNGNYLWMKRGDNYYDDRGLGLCLDPMGYIYITGTCWGGLTFGSLNVYNSTAYTDQIYVIKLDNNGNEIWMKNAGVDSGGSPYNDDHGQDLVADSSGNVYVTGFLSNNRSIPLNATFDALNIPMLPHDSLAFLAKLDNSGNWQWVKTFPGIYGYRDNALGIDDEQNVYVTGGFVGTKIFETTTLTSKGKEDIYVIKYAPNGNFQFILQAGDSLKDRGDNIVYGNDGHMYVTGEFRNKVAFGNDTINNNGSPGGKDIFVAKMTKSGQWVWASKAGSNKGQDRGIGITANKKGNIFVTGQFSGNAKFGSIDLDGNGDSVQIFVAAIDTLGKWRWAIQAGSPHFDRGADIDCDTNCNLYITGYYNETMVMGSLTTTAISGHDIFTAKINDACFGYDSPVDPNPDPTVSIDTSSGFIFTEANVFSPNDDQVNDLLYLVKNFKGTGEVLIINRWGNAVYQTNDVNLPWNGKDQRGSSVVDGTYFYTLNLVFINGTVMKRQGFITVVR